MIRKCIAISILTAAMTGTAHARGAVPYVFNLPTSETYGSRILMFDTGHRYFDPVKHTTNVNIALGYGIIDSLNVDIARSFRNMDTVFSAKYRLLDDSSAGPEILSLAFIAGGGYKEDAEKVLKQDDQGSFFAQIVLEKRLFSNRLILGTVPIFAWNTNFYGVDSSRDSSLGLGLNAAFYVFDRISVCAELIMNLYGFGFKYMNYNAGVKYAGYRHTFSIWISNCSGYSPVEYSSGSTTLDPKASFAFTREFDL